ncbi:MAG: hypothetical protein V1772_14315 [Chloroflexota bacterium]
MDDRTLGYLTTLDWVTPTAAYIQDLIHGGGHTFVLARDARLQQLDLQAGLSRYGIESWGLITLDEAVLITVPKDKAAWGENRLRTLGLAILSGGQLDPRGSPARGGPLGPLRQAWRTLLGP